ncbi:patatin-like phospholipase family protein [Caulobacter sp.]|uniref:patatin-like phospholipase family protein n=1 Tax=Caulobacter sp. TaxID=78 RepID=UPI002B49363D|nr:patatin-like phospholipase family protein [Caulobacter sp.]HJV43124.1 patatin-like phospholipase family protein [Caulobacter sp.]
MTYRILSFCGGGIRGLLSAIMLQRLQASTGVKLADQADLIVGTSTGSWITALLTAGYGPADIVSFYNPLMAAAMSVKQTSPTKPEYGGGLIDKVLQTLPIFGIFGKPLNELGRTIMVASFEIGAEGIPWTPQLIHNFPNSPTSNMSLLDAVHCSGAMPGMLAPAAITLNGQPKRFVDGAFMHHDPTIAAIALAVANGAALEDISVLDFGTGFMANYITADVSTWGSQQWMNGDGQTDGVLPPLLVNVTNPGPPIFNMLLNGTSTNLMPDLAGMMLGGRFAYLNPDFGGAYVAEDDVSTTALKFLSDTANAFSLSAAETVVNSYWS